MSHIRITARRSDGTVIDRQVEIRNDQRCEVALAKAWADVVGAASRVIARFEVVRAGRKRREPPWYVADVKKAAAHATQVTGAGKDSGRR